MAAPGTLPPGSRDWVNNEVSDQRAPFELLGWVGRSAEIENDLQKRKHFVFAAESPVKMTHLLQP